MRFDAVKTRVFWARNANRSRWLFSRAESSQFRQAGCARRLDGADWQALREMNSHKLRERQRMALAVMNRKNPRGRIRGGFVFAMGF